ncbi:unnamed protein product [Staurois parvus]|uniref:Uncharacterized protein n=1 Tax=Staurois parvus TaxID=386267 RepID=A0ABN9G8L0_9NEOB|nr:unnamed protein product [Staurois parvus]
MSGLFMWLKPPVTLWQCFLNPVLMDPQQVMFSGFPLFCTGMDWPAMVGLTCLLICSTRAGQRVLPAIRDSTFQPANTWN